MSSPRLPIQLCPSAPCEEGAIVLGIVGPNGIAYLSPKMRADHSFCNEAAKHGPPERHFRFAQPCAEERCRQWTGGSCGLITKVISAAREFYHAEVQRDLPPALPRCTIRNSCRWFAQEAAAACSVCPMVVTDQRREELPNNEK